MKKKVVAKKKTQRVATKSLARKSLPPSPESNGHSKSNGTVLALDAGYSPVEAKRLADLAERYATAPLTKAPQGRITHYSDFFDRAMRYLTDDPTAPKLKALVRRVDAGDVAALCETQLELIRKDAQLAGIVQTRHNAITALDWCIEPDPDFEDDALAQEAAEYISEHLKSIPMFPKVLEHLVFAIGPNVSVAEIIWDKAEVVDFVLVPVTRLATNPYTNTGLVIRTDDDPIGIPIEAYPGKFMVYQPYSKGGFPFRATLTHASLIPFLMGTLSRIDWLSFSELFAMPLRVGFYDDTTLPEDRTQAQDMLNRMSTDTAAMLPKGIGIQFLQAQGSGETYREQLHYSDNKFAILWLGQTLTSDIVGTGSYAAAKVHNRVRSDILASDLRKEDYFLRWSLFKPMLDLKFPRRNAPIPVFRRETSVIDDIDSRKLKLEQLQFAATQGLEVPRRWLYDALSIPRPGQGDSVKLSVQFKGEDPATSKEKGEDADRKAEEREAEAKGDQGEGG